MSTFRNWHKPQAWYRTKLSKISNIFPVFATRNVNGNLDIEFQNEDGNKILFSLDKYHTALLLMHIDKNFHKKEGIKNEDYGLSSTEPKLLQP